MAQALTSPFDNPDRVAPEVIANPYPSYDELRTRDPVHWNDGLKYWALTRYPDVLAALRDRRLSMERMSFFVGRLPEPVQEMMAPVTRLFSNMMLMSDPPKHTRLRSLANKAFTPRVVEAIRSHIQAIVDRALDKVEEAGKMDVIADLAYPLPVTVICEMLGVAPEDREQFKNWSDDLAYFLGDIRRAAQHIPVAQQSALAMTEYLKDIIRECRRNPRDNLISALVAVEEQGEVFSEEELFSMFILLHLGGHETTTNLIGNGLLALLQNPDQLEKLKADPSLIETAVEEFLRYNSPIQSTIRLALEDLEIGGQSISQGQWVGIYIGAANTDPAQFADPDRLDITRRENRHLAFGFGPHFCLGAALARLEGQIAINTVLRRMRHLRLEPPFSPESPVEEFPWRNNRAFHGLESLPVAFNGAS